MRRCDWFYANAEEYEAGTGLADFDTLRCPRDAFFFLQSIEHLYAYHMCATHTAEFSLAQSKRTE